MYDGPNKRMKIENPGVGQPLLGPAKINNTMLCKGLKLKPIPIPSCLKETYEQSFRGPISPVELPNAIYSSAKQLLWPIFSMIIIKE